MTSEERRKFNLHELVKVNDPGNDFHGQAGHVRAVDEPRMHPGVYVYTVEFAGENRMPSFTETALEKIYSTPAENYKEDRPSEMKKFRTDDPLLVARELVHQLFYGEMSIPLDDVYVVWFCSTVQNWKALISTNILDNAYYEVTHNGSKNETYVDRYFKDTNVKVTYNDSAQVDVVEFNAIS